MWDLRRACSRRTSVPPLLFFHPADPSDGDRFFERFWPEARAIADREGFFYAAVGLGRGRLKQLFGPAVFKSAMRAMRGGHSIGRPTGDIFRMPGIYIVEGPAIIHAMPLADAGEKVDVEAILDRF